ncbi:unnamed protein product [Prunus armeniaca]
MEPQQENEDFAALFQEIEPQKENEDFAALFQEIEPQQVAALEQGSSSGINPCYQKSVQGLQEFGQFQETGVAAPEQQLEQGSSSGINPSYYLQSAQGLQEFGQFQETEVAAPAQLVQGSSSGINKYVPSYPLEPNMPKKSLQHRACLNNKKNLNKVGASKSHLSFTNLQPKNMQSWQHRTCLCLNNRNK